MPHPYHGQVPEAARNAAALDGLQRQTDPAETKSEIGFQHDPEDEDDAVARPTDRRATDFRHTLPTLSVFPT